MYTALLGCLTTPGLNGMRFALVLFKFSVFEALTESRFSRTTVRPWCHLFLRQQTWQETEMMFAARSRVPTVRSRPASRWLMRRM
jgi:hypothetical protein